ncbi:unnamed protein product [Cuscuta epithymum]|uniref:DYW domain-containing protein n=1 Tax=Cuscuta epithymum TaxID=186058 RepID=A0AAV0FP05_9ASTE|nr:unnamed protein product [Cuscuta epithymum]
MISLSLPVSAQLSSSPSIKPRSLSTPKAASVQFQKNSDFQVLKDRLIRQANGGNIRQAISTLDLISQMGFTPDLASYAALLKSCIRTRNFKLGKSIHSRLGVSPLEPDTIVLNSLISLYAKCGDWETAKEIFDAMGARRDMVSWSVMISCYARCNMEREAVLTFVEMVSFGEYPNQFCFSAAIKACSNARFGSTGLAIFGFVVKTGYFDSDVCVGCAVIDLFSKGLGDLESSQKVFEEMPEKNSVCWTLLIARLSQLGNTKDAIHLFEEMLLNGFTPDRFTLSSILSSCADMGLGWLSFGQQLHCLVMKSGLSMDVWVGCSLVNMYSKSSTDGSMDYARKVFDRMSHHNVMSWTALITGYAQTGGDREAINLYCMMIETRVKPNHYTFCSLLKACGNLSCPDIGQQIYNHAVKSGLAAMNCVTNSLISMFAKSSRFDDAWKAFEFLFEKNCISYNIIADGYAKNLDSSKAFELFNQTEESGVEVDAFTFATLLSAAASIGAVSKGEEIHARLLKSGFQTNQSVCNALISMYSKCGNIEAASQVFNESKNRNAISWTSIITGFAKHGFAKRALELFCDMVSSGVKPNEVTYIAVLLACSHVGLVDSGWKHFNLMSIEHGIRPRMEHYACMVDLLGRSGNLENAVRFIKCIPFTPGAIIWRTLLGACQVHGNMMLGEHAAKMVLEWDPQDTAAHVLLSNIYASTGNWEEVARIRKDMKERKVVKEAGCSWIETGNKMNKFYVGDTKHPQAKEIHRELDRLVVEIKGLGYIPNTTLVLHDVEEEHKEQYLFQHSEKIAVAFGLISTAKPKPIRIFKNLRVCKDCHTAMKYISIATGRELVLRDSNRFHHIKDGACSCNDYW